MWRRHTSASVPNVHEHFSRRDEDRLSFGASESGVEANLPAFLDVALVQGVHSDIRRVVGEFHH